MTGAFSKWVRDLRIGFIIGAMLMMAGHIDAEDALIGTKPNEWQLTDWINSQPLKLKELEGKVVLVRWWTAPTCPYCAATAPALNEFYHDYHSKGLEVVGVYHHKAPEPLRVDDVKKYATKYGFKFPVAVDPNWQTLQKWWLDKGDKNWTSVTFLIDKHGIIRHIHPGGQYVKGDKEYDAMKASIESLLGEK